MFGLSGAAFLTLAHEGILQMNEANNEPMLEKAPYLVLGLDAGKSSLGWCLLDLANKRVVALNSRLFEDPAVPKTDASKASVRSAARRARRLNNRRRNIRAHCLRLIEEFDLLELPHDAGGALNVKACGELLQRKPGESGVLELRIDALTRSLSGRELSRVLYWFSSHRGYIPHGEPSTDDKDAGKVLTALTANAAAMEEGGYTTLAEYQASISAANTDGHWHNKASDYSLCVSNAQYVAEIDSIFEKQQSLDSTLASDVLKERFLDECFTYLTDTTAQEARIYSRVAPCIYFAPEKATAKCCPSFEMARAWEKLLHARIRSEQGEERPLSRSTVEAAINQLFSTESISGKNAKKLTWKTLRKIENMSGRESFKGVSADDEKQAVCETPAWSAFRKALPSELLERMLEDRALGDAIGSALAYASREDSLKRIVRVDASTDMPELVTNKLAELSEEEAEAVCAIDCTGKSFSGYGTRSARALRMIVTEFEQGACKLYDAEKELGLYDKRTEAIEAHDFLGMYETFDQTCSNPVVLRAMSQVRKVVNAVIREYGRPAEIHVELARELKLSKKLKAEIDSKNTKRRKERDKRRAETAMWMGITPADVSNRLLLKVELLEEQGWRDAYSGEAIHKEDFIANPRMIEVDHILPYSRSLDDSQSNKVAVLARSNQNKGQRTPYEWMTAGESATPSWAEFCARVGASELRAAKKSKLLEKEFAEKEAGFIDRNLNDTRYMTRRMAMWLADSLRFADLPEGKTKHVLTPSGGATSLLRHCWGFDAKDRSKSELHHAVDAAIIAACNQSIVQKVARVHSEKHFTPKDAYKAKLANAVPWSGFAEEVQALAAIAIPSRMADRSRTGRLFEDTLYRIEGYNDKGLGVLAYGKGAAKKARPSGNYIKLSSGAFAKPDGIAFLQLWWDPKGIVHGKKTPGCWLSDPVYFADVRDFENGTYAPKFGKQGVPRTAWERVPERAMKHEPIRLCRGDAILVKGQVRIFVGFNISSYQWTIAYPDKDLTNAKHQGEATKGLAISSCDFDDISLLETGPLGLPFGPKN